MKLAESFLARGPILLSALDENVVPEVIGATKDQCTWCPYKRFCEDDGFNKITPPYKKKAQKKKKVEVKKIVQEQPKKKVPEAKFLL